MANYFREEGDAQFVGGGGYGGGFGGGGFGGCFVWIILVVVILWLLFRSDRNDGCNNNGYGGGYNMPYPIYPPYAPYGGGGNCCSPLDCKIPMAPDMSNCEVDKDIWKLDAHMERCCCEEKEVAHCEGEKTRALIADLNLQNLRDKLAEANAEKAAIESKYYTEKKFGDIEALLCKYDNGNDKQYYNLSSQIAALKCDFDCNIPKRAPIYACGTTPDVHNIDCHDFPRRRGCGNDCDCC